MSKFKPLKNRVDIDTVFYNNNQPIKIKIQQITFKTADFMPKEVILDIAVPTTIYNEIIDKNSYFYLQSENRNESALEVFEEDKMVELELILSKDLLPYIQISMNNPKQLEAIFNKEKHTFKEKQLFDESNWYALNVKQSVEVPNDTEGTLKMGYSTVWNKSRIKEAKTFNFTPFFSTIYNFFKAKAGKLQVDGENTAIRFSYAIQKGYVNCLVDIREEYKQILFYSYPSHPIAAEHLPKLMEMVIDINTNIRIGSLDLDRKNQVFYFRTYIDLEEQEIKDEWLELLFDSNIYQMNKYYNTIIEALKEE